MHSKKLARFLRPAAAPLATGVPYEWRRPTCCPPPLFITPARARSSVRTLPSARGNISALCRVLTFAPPLSARGPTPPLPPLPPAASVLDKICRRCPVVRGGRRLLTPATATAIYSDLLALPAAPASVGAGADKPQRHPHPRRRCQVYCFRAISLQINVDS